MFESAVFRIAPFDEIPEPVISIGSATFVRLPDTDNTAPDDTVVFPTDVPNAVLFEIATTPVEIFVTPAYVFAAESVRVLAESVSFVTVPVPEMTPDNVWSSEDEYTSAALFTMFEVKLFGVPAPSDPEPVTESVPAESVSVPANVLSADRATVPAPSFVSAKAPETTPDSVAVFPDAALTLEADPIVTVPDNVPDAEKYNAPLAADVPLMIKGSAELSEPLPATSSVAPAVTEVVERVPPLSPSAASFAILSVPAETTVVPV